MKISIVATLFLSSRYLQEFHRRITATVNGITDDYELILVNDGSPDNSLEVARELLLHDRHIVVLDLSRNFGHHRAIMAGLERSTGDYVFLIDVDLEEDPESLGAFWQYLSAHPEADVVIGESPTKQQGSLFRRFASSWFYDLFNFLSDIHLSKSELVSRLMRRRYVESLMLYREREIFIPGILADVGYNQHYLPAQKTFDGNSTYTLRRRIAMAVDAITSFSSKPLLMMFYMGSSFVMFATFVILYLLINKLLFGYAVLGWASLAATLFFIGGITIFSLGIVGMYVAKIYREVKQRPNVIVKAVYQEDRS